MAIKIVCTEEVGEFNKGDEVIDPAAIEAARNAYPHAFVAVSVPDAAPATKG